MQTCPPACLPAVTEQRAVSEAEANRGGEAASGAGPAAGSQRQQWSRLGSSAGTAGIAAWAGGATRVATAAARGPANAAAAARGRVPTVEANGLKQTAPSHCSRACPAVGRRGCCCMLDVVCHHPASIHARLICLQTSMVRHHHLQMHNRSLQPEVEGSGASKSASGFTAQHSPRVRAAVRSKCIDQKELYRIVAKKGMRWGMITRATFCAFAALLCVERHVYQWPPRWLSARLSGRRVGQAGGPAPLSVPV